MKKIFLLSFLQVALMLFVKAQVSDGEIEFNKAKRHVKTMEVNEAPDVVEQAVKNKMLKHGYKHTESRGWLIFKNVNDPEFSAEPCDLHIKVERKSRKEKESSVIYFFASKPNDHVTPVALAGGMLVAEGFHGHITSHAHAEKLERDIKEQEETIAKAQKKYDNLVKDQSSLEKKIKDLQSDLEKNKQDQQAQSQELENQNKILEQLKARRNS